MYNPPAPQCMNCGNPLEPGAAVCRYCGRPVAAAAAPNPPPAQPYPPYAPPVYAPARPAAGRFPWWALILGCGCLCILCVCVALAAGGIFAANQASGMDVSDFENLPFLTEMPISPILTEMPGLEDLPFATAIPLPFDGESEPDSALISPEDNPAADSAGGLWLDYRSQWEVADTHQYLTDISQQGDWSIGIKVPEISVAVYPPIQPDAWSANYVITVDMSSLAPGQIAGIRCQVQDESNYYQVVFRDLQYAVGSVVDGELTPLTDPYWQTSQFIGAGGLMGGANVSVTCAGSDIGLSIEGLGEFPLISDPAASFTSGAVALFAEAADQATSLFYSKAFFSNFTIEEIQ